MALVLELLETAYGANSPEYIAEYAVVNGINEAQAEAQIKNNDALLPRYLERYGHKWEISLSSWEQHHVQKVYGETSNSSPFDDRVVTYDYEGILCSLSESQSTQILKRIARALRNRDIAVYGEANIVVL